MPVIKLQNHLYSCQCLLIWYNPLNYRWLFKNANVPTKTFFSVILLKIVYFVLYLHFSNMIDNNHHFEKQNKIMKLWINQLSISVNFFSFLLNFHVFRVKLYRQLNILSQAKHKRWPTGHLQPSRVFGVTMRGFQNDKCLGSLE